MISNHRAISRNQQFFEKEPILLPQKEPILLPQHTIKPKTSQIYKNCFNPLE